MPRCGLSSQMVTSRFGSWYGSGRRSTALITLNIAVFAPMPRARVITAMTVNPGCFSRLLIPWRRSLNSVSIFLRGLWPLALFFEADWQSTRIKQTKHKKLRTKYKEPKQDSRPKTEDQRPKNKGLFV